MRIVKYEIEIEKIDHPPYLMFLLIKKILRMRIIIDMGYDTKKLKEWREKYKIEKEEKK